MTISSSWSVGLDFGPKTMTAVAGRLDAHGRLVAHHRARFPGWGTANDHVIQPTTFQHSLGPVVSWLRRELPEPVVSIALTVPSSYVQMLPSSAESFWQYPVMVDELIVDLLRRQSLRAPAAAGLLLHSRICRFQSGENSYDRAPYGDWSTHLRVETQSWVALSRFVGPLAAALGTFGLALGVVAPRPVAAAEAVLKPPERQPGVGVLLIDIDYHRTEIACYHSGELIELFTLPHGQRAVIAGLAAAFNVPEATAERIDLDEMFRSAAGQPIVERTRAVLRARAGKLFSAIKERLEVDDLGWRTTPGVVLTGCGASLPEIALTARETLMMPARLGIPPVGSPAVDLDTDAAAAYGVAALQARTLDAARRAPDDRGEALSGYLDVRTGLERSARRGKVRPALTRWLREFIPVDDTT